MSLATFLAKLEKKNVRTFLLPDLQEEITYRKMDIIESSVDNSLPTFLAARVLDTMKKSVSGQTPTNDPVNLEDKDIQELLVRATEMWKKLVTDPILEMEDIIKISSQDRLAWFLHAVGESQQEETQGGGVVTGEEVTNFPDTSVAKGSAKRTTNS